MKKLVLAAAIFASTAASPAFAQATDSQDLVISATVPQECSIANPSDITFASVGINQAAGSTALLMNGQPNSSQNVWTSCNYAAKITVAGAPLLNAAGADIAANDSADFTNSINYVVAFEPPAAGGPFSKVTLNTRVGATASTTPAGAFHENAKLTVQIPSDPANNPKRPVAGTYTATTTITLGAI